MTHCRQPRTCSQIQQKMNYPTVKFPNDTTHMLFDIGYTQALLWRTKVVLRWALAETDQGEHVTAEMRAILEEIESVEKGRLQSVDALYANAEDAMEVLNRIAAAQNQ
jgi:hypothetical protein